ncbi:MAG: HAD-IB family hydrolase [Pontimonas sp.]|nr:HAD-IB family hydrolase [Pontimonas sp.]
MTSKSKKSAGSPVVVFVDVDNTLVRGASIYMFGIEAWKSGFIRWHHVVPALFHQRSFIKQGETTKRVKSTRERAQALAAGHSVADFVQVGESAWRRSIAPKVFPDVLATLQEHRDQGRQVWLLTASPTVLASIIARDLRLSGALGTTLEIHEGRFTGEIEGELLHGPIKAAAAKELAESLGADLSACYAYSDSVADVPLLELVGHPVAVNPDPGLLALATERGWSIMWPEGTSRHEKSRTKKGREKR